MHPATEENDYAHRQIAEGITWRILSSDSNSPQYAKLRVQSSFAKVHQRMHQRVHHPRSDYPCSDPYDPTFPILGPLNPTRY